jgi:C4-dicarboxylate transporter DctM subunit
MMIYLIIVLIVCLLLTVPMSATLGLAGMAMVWQTGTPSMIIAQRLFAAVDSAPLLAIPFFVLAGNFMNSGGISKRLISFANSCLGSYHGGLAIVTIAASMFFAAISGSGPATTFAIGSIMIPARVSKGYDVRFAATTQATAGQLGVIIPPSIPFVIFGIATGVSVGDLFMAGFMPGILIGFSLMIVAYIVSKKSGFRGDRKFSWAERWMTFKDSIWAIMMPVIILGGIYSGVFTPTESAVVASAYALFVGSIVYREIKLSHLYKIFADSAIMVSTIMIIISTAGIFAYILTVYRIPHIVGEWFISVTTSKIVFLLIINILLLFVGMFFDTTPAIVVLGPIFMPVAESLGINPIHFGVIMVCNLAMGFITPPFGVNLFVISQLTKLRVEQLGKTLIMYVIVLFIDILIISFIPAISLWLPSMMK